LWIGDNGIKSGDMFNDVDSDEYKRAEAYVREHFSTWLPTPHESGDEFRMEMESHPDYNPAVGEYDNDHPCSRRVDPSLNYGTAGTPDTLVFEDNRARDDYRNILKAVQMHTCCFTCHKYGHESDCRFGNPWQISEKVQLISTKDAKGRLRHKVSGPRNNANINGHCGRPHVTSTWTGNSDAKFIVDELVYVPERIVIRIRPSRKSLTQPL